MLDFVVALTCLQRGRDATSIQSCGRGQSPSYLKYAKCTQGTICGKQEGAILRGSTTLKVIKAHVCMYQGILEVFLSRLCLPGELYNHLSCSLYLRICGLHLQDNVYLGLSRWCLGVANNMGFLYRLSLLH